MKAPVNLHERNGNTVCGWTHIHANITQSDFDSCSLKKAQCACSPLARFPLMNCTFTLFKVHFVHNVDCIFRFVCKSVLIILIIARVPTTISESAGPLTNEPSSRSRGWSELRRSTRSLFALHQSCSPPLAFTPLQLSFIQSGTVMRPIGLGCVTGTFWPNAWHPEWTSSS